MFAAVVSTATSAAAAGRCGTNGVFTSPGTCTYSATGASDTFTVPAGVTSIQVDALGGQGDSAFGGLGGEVVATIPVNPGDTLQVNVGGAGVGGTGGYNGGGGTGGSAGAGGGASDVRTGGFTIGERVVVAGGGGGGFPGAGATGYGNGSGIFGMGGAGGYVGEDGASGPCAPTYGSAGGGATQTAPGVINGQGYRINGDVWRGAGNGAGASGGAGYYGGGSGDNNASCGPGGGGGGGSNHAAASATGVRYVTGANTGDGKVTVTTSGGGPGSSGRRTFSYTGSAQFFKVPPGVTSVQVDAYGAQGWGNFGGLGGLSRAIVPVTPGATLLVYVGGVGALNLGGFDGGGGRSGFGAGGGGGASDVRIGGSAPGPLNPLSDRAVIGGGGGGEGPNGGPNGGQDGGAGGAGGGVTGGAGGPDGSCVGGGGGTQTSGGAAGGQGGSGRLGMGGDSGGGDGGGGLYGGGVGQAAYPCRGSAGGGGGSAYAPPGTSSCTQAGVNAGNGSVAITYPALSTTVSCAPPPSPPANSERDGGNNPSVRQCSCSQGSVAQPVDTFTGNFWHTFDDLATPGRGIALDVTRTYNSDASAAFDAGFGPGWSWTYGMSIGADGSNEVVHQENGSTVTFVPNGSAWAPQAPRMAATLTHNGDGTWTFVRRARETFAFDSSGRLTSETDLNGYTTQVAYPSSTSMTVTDPAGRVYTFTRDASGHTVSVADQSSPPRALSYAYDGNGNLSDVTDVAGGNTHFVYDTGHRLLTMRFPNQAPGVPGSTGAVVTNTYDSQGRVAAQSDQLSHTTSFDYTTIPGSTKVTDPAGNVTVDTYQSGLRIAQTRGYGTPQAATTLYDYDPNTLGISDTADPDGNISHATYDASGNQLSATDPLGRTTTWTYDALNDRTSVTYPKTFGSTHESTTWVYDSHGNLTSESSPLLDANGNTTATRTTTYLYGDSFAGDVTGVIDPDSNTTTIAYDAYGDRTSTTDPLGDTTSDTYNTIGWLTSSVSPLGGPGNNYAKLPGASGSEVSAPDSPSLEVSGDIDLRVLAAATNWGATGQYQVLVAKWASASHSASYALDIDPNGKLLVGWTTNGTTFTGASVPLGLAPGARKWVRATVQVNNGAGGWTAQFFTSGDGQTWTLLGAPQTGSGPTSIYRGSAPLEVGSADLGTDPGFKGRVYAAQVRNGIGGPIVANPDFRSASSTPVTDTEGNTFTFQGTATLVMAASQYTTSYGHDAWGHTTTVTDPLGHVSTRHYDPDQNRDWSKDADHAASTCTPGQASPGCTVNVYDAADEQTQVFRPDGTSTATHYNADGTVQYTLDGAGNTTSYTYDPLARVASTTTPPSQTCNTGDTTTSTYDGVGNLLTKTDPGPGCGTGGTTTDGYDAASELISIAYSDGVTPNVTIGYEADGQRSSMTDASGLTSTWTYDSLHRLTSSVNGANRTVSYGYDLRGQLTSIAYPGNVGSVTRHYDAAGRMDLVTDWQNHTTRFGYDADGNLIDQTDPNGTSRSDGFDQADQLSGIAHNGLQGTLASFGYGRDANGQETSVSSTGLAADTHTYSYTTLNQLQNVDLPATAYGYDAADNPAQLPPVSGFANSPGPIVQRFNPASELVGSSQIGIVTSAANQAVSTSPMISFGAPVVANDVILLAVSEPAPNQPSGPPTGYSLVGAYSSGTAGVNTNVYVRTAIGGESSATVPNPLPIATALNVVVYRGLDPNAPVEAVAANTAAASTAVSVAGVSATTAGDRLAMVAGAAGYPGKGTFTPSPPLQDQAQQPGTNTVVTGDIADQPLSAVGPTGARTDTLNATATGLVGVLLALKPGTTYSYDPRGNRTVTRAPWAPTINYGYDQANRLVSSGSATYVYRGDGLRAAKTISGTTADSTWDEAQGTPLLLSDGTLDYVYGPGGNVIEQLAPTHQPISLVGTASGGATGTGTLTISLPAGTQAGDQILVGIMGSSSGVGIPNNQYNFEAVVTPSGLVSSQQIVLARTAAASDTTVTFNYFNMAISVVVAVYRGVDPALPIDGFASGTSSAGPTATAPSVTAGANGDRLVMVEGAAEQAVAANWAAPPGMTDQVHKSDQPLAAAALADQTLTNAGPTGPRTATFGTTAQLAATLIALRPLPDALYFHQDQLGSTRLLTNSAGNVVATYTYTPYGQLTGATITGSSGTPIGYAGQYTDAETEFIYLRGRYYDPATGQFLTRDPVAAMTQSAYGYVDDNPLNQTDPLGLCFFCLKTVKKVGNFLTKHYLLPDLQESHWIGYAVGFAVGVGCAIVTGGAGALGCYVLGHVVAAGTSWLFHSLGTDDNSPKSLSDLRLTSANDCAREGRQFV